MDNTPAFPDWLPTGTHAGARILPGSGARISVDFAFKVGDKVRVREIDRPGMVDLMQYDNAGPMYRVCYWDNCERKTTWCYDWELELK